MGILSKLKIRTKMFLGVTLLLLLVSVGMGMVSYHSAVRSLQVTVEESLPSIATEAGKFISSHLENRILAIEGVASRNVIRSMDWELQKPALEFERTRLGFMGMGIVSPDGATRYADGNTAELGDREYVKEAFRGNTNFSDIIISRVLNQPVLMLATPIKGDDGAVKSVLIARLDGNFLSKFTDGIRYGKRGYSYIINNKGELIAHDNRDFVLNAKNFLKEGKTEKDFFLLSKMMQRMVNGETGFDQYWFMGYERFFGYSTIPGTDWSLAVGAIKEEVFAEINTMQKKIIFSGIIFMILSIAAAIFFANSLTFPILSGVHRLTQVAQDGNLNSKSDIKLLQRGDELGQLSVAIQDLIDFQKKQADILVKLSEGNWDVDIEVRSDKDAVGNALKVMIKQLNETLLSVKQVVMQVNTGSTQIADSAQTLSQGATETAASLEQITASMTEMASQTRLNADNAGQADSLSRGAQSAAANGSKLMTDLVKAMGDINRSGEDISKIIKVIDEIAFQTNLLALNAAVEAARAGQHGKGFAVVAEEVRNLAGRSAKAAKETAELIENSTAKTRHGNDIVEKTEAALEEIVSGTTKVSDLVAEIAAASSEQSEGIGQVNTGLGQIDQVTQQNTANAEESAAAAEELASQATHLQSMLAQFKLQGGSVSAVKFAPQQTQAPGRSTPALSYSNKKADSTSSVPWPGKETAPSQIIALDDKEFGKY